jgi:hypothetical protein
LTESKGAVSVRHDGSPSRGGSSSRTGAIW